MALNSVFSIEKFKDNLKFDGARPNLFTVNIFFPSDLQAIQGQNLPQEIQFMCKTAQLPGSSVSTVTVPYQGREVKLAGNRRFPDWTVTIINDEDFKFRNAFEIWMNYINGHQSNKRGDQPGTGGDSPNTNILNYYAPGMTVSQYGKGGAVKKRYDFIGAFPTDVSPIELDWGNNDSIEEFQVTFSYQYWVSTLPESVNS